MSPTPEHPILHQSLAEEAGVEDEAVEEEDGAEDEEGTRVAEVDVVDGVAEGEDEVDGTETEAEMEVTRRREEPSRAKRSLLRRHPRPAPPG